MRFLLHNLVRQLEQRRQQLGMTCPDIARATGLSVRTIQRVLSGEEQAPSFSTILALADAVGASLKLECENVMDVKKRQAKRKAVRLAALTQGTSALEAQAVPPETVAELTEQTMYELLAGPPRRLWAE